MYLDCIRPPIRPSSTRWHVGCDITCCGKVNMQLHRMEGSSPSVQQYGSWDMESVCLNISQTVMHIEIAFQNVVRWVWGLQVCVAYVDREQTTMCAAPTHSALSLSFSRYAIILCSRNTLGSIYIHAGIMLQLHNSRIRQPSFYPNRFAVQSIIISNIQ